MRIHFLRISSTQVHPFRNWSCHIVEFKLLVKLTLKHTESLGCFTFNKPKDIPKFLSSTPLQMSSDLCLRPKTFCLSKLFPNAIVFSTKILFDCSFFLIQFVKSLNNVCTNFISFAGMIFIEATSFSPNQTTAPLGWWSRKFGKSFLDVFSQPPSPHVLLPSVFTFSSTFFWRLSVRFHLAIQSVRHKSAVMKMKKCRSANIVSSKEPKIFAAGSGVWKVKGRIFRSLWFTFFMPASLSSWICSTSNENSSKMLISPAPKGKSKTLDGWLTRGSGFEICLRYFFVLNWGKPKRWTNSRCAYEGHFKSKAHVLQYNVVKHRKSSYKN